MDEEILASLADEIEQWGANPEMLDVLIQVVQAMLQNPEQYEDLRMQVIMEDIVDPEDVPEQFDEGFLMAVLQVLDHVKSQLSSPARQFKKGGLAALKRKGRGGDTMLAHINPMEAEVLRRMGGSGSINPNTGLPEFKKGGFKSIFKAVAKIAPIAMSFMAPGIGTAIGGFLAPSLSGTLQSALGSAIMGGASGLLGGGGGKGLLKGALMGGLGSLAGSAFGAGTSAPISQSPNALPGFFSGAGGEGIIPATSGGFGGAISGQASQSVPSLSSGAESAVRMTSAPSSIPDVTPGSFAEAATAGPSISDYISSVPQETWKGLNYAVKGIDTLAGMQQRSDLIDKQQELMDAQLAAYRQGKTPEQLEQERQRQQQMGGGLWNYSFGRPMQSSFGRI